MNEERRLHKRVCNVSYPFFRAKAKVGAEGPAGRGRAWGPERGEQTKAGGAGGGLGEDLSIVAFWGYRSVGKSACPACMKPWVGTPVTPVLMRWRQKVTS